MSDTCATMSDVASNRISVRLPELLTSRLRSRSRSQGKSESKLVREALEQYLGQPMKSAYDLAKEIGVIGVIDKAPKDLSTNRRHLNGFGRGR